jgi:hypothetical protein
MANALDEISCVELITMLWYCVIPVSKVDRLLLQGNSVTVDGCCVCSSCCAKEFLIPKEYPVVLS